MKLFNTKKKAEQQREEADRVAELNRILAEKERELEELKHQREILQQRYDVLKANVQSKQPETRVELKKPEQDDLIAPDGITLTDEQKEVIRLLETTNGNYFVTGKAGTGKSVLLKAFLMNTEKKTAVLAPTGIAAINVEGQTIHSFFGLDIAAQDTGDQKNIMNNMSKKRVDLLNSLDALIIDEISMARVDVIDMVDQKMRWAKKKYKIPFGGCQIIVFGDLYQLPPVVKRDDESTRFLKQRYPSFYFFGAPGVIDHPFKLLELQNVIRQSDQTFVSILNNMRIGRTTSRDLAVLNSRVQKCDEPNTITLTTKNAAASAINKQKLNELPSSSLFYYGYTTGSFSDDELPTNKELELKAGAQVMMIKNDSEGHWVNGTICTIEDLNDFQIKVRINGSVYSVNKETWTKYVYTVNEETHRLEKQEVGTFTQYPMKLAYAITIHKSQGQTYDSVVIDYSNGNAFATGQTYVALSRCRSLEHLYFRQPLSMNDIKVDQEVLAYMNNSLVLQNKIEPSVLSQEQPIRQRRFEDVDPSELPF